jgi:hypothetical protein
MHTIIIAALSIIVIGLIIILLFSTKEKKKLRKDREQGIVDRYILLENFENTIKKLVKAKKDDPQFMEEFERKYLDEMNDLLKRTNLFIDYKQAQRREELSMENVEPITEIITLAKLYVNTMKRIRSGDENEMQFVSGELPFQITSKGLIFFSPKYPETKKV